MLFSCSVVTEDRRQFRLMGNIKDLGFLFQQNFNTPNKMTYLQKSDCDTNYKSKTVFLNVQLSAD